MAVRIRMKKLGRKHRPFYRICAMDIRRPRDGRVLEELGTYDPLVPETDARAMLNGERINYWLSVGAQPSDKVQVLIKKYGAEGTHAGGAAGWPWPGWPAASRPPAPSPGRRSRQAEEADGRAGRGSRPKPARKPAEAADRATPRTAAATRDEPTAVTERSPRCVSTF